MCGIAGIWGDPSSERLKMMADSLQHRGPDDEGFWTSGSGDAGLAHRRLSIIDLEGGHQPLTNEDGRIVTVFNGEIYNYRELRQELTAGGHKFATNSDTETIVHLYEDEGPLAAARLRGMFAIAIWDDRQHQLVLIRDRVGKKPLYFSEAGGEFLFGSELKALAAAMRTPLSLDDQVLSDYLTWGEIMAPATIYREIRAVEPGEYVVVRDRQVTQKRHYWQLQMQPKTSVSPADAVEQVDGLLREAVRLRLRSDVPVGSFLSGGIDSGIITAMASEEQADRLTTITIGFEEESFDERPLARQVAKRYGTDHHEVVIRPQVAQDLPTIAACYDQPFANASCVPSYYVAQAARQVVKVVLNGDGGDELFGGSRRYLAARINQWLAWADGPLTRAACRGLTAPLPTPRRFRSGYAFLHRLLRGFGQEPVARYLTWAVDMMPESEKRRMCGTGKPGASSAPARRQRDWLARLAPSEWLVRDYWQTELQDCGAVDRMLAADYTRILPHELLVKMDVACMAHGLEPRSPLLDHVLVDTVARYPERVKVPGLTTKPLLRELSGRYLPPVVQEAPKRGFEVPLVRWLRNELRDLSADVVLARNGLLADRFDRSALEHLLSGSTGLDPARWSRRVWTLLMLGIWDQHVRPKQRTEAVTA